MNLFGNLFRVDISQLPFLIISLVLAFTVHEFAHAFVAYKFGDPTAKNEGRLTLNPMVHLDPIGTLMILLVGFGWARPVPVNRYYFKKPRLAGVLVSLAGPVSNLLMAFVATLLLFLFDNIGVFQMLPHMASSFLLDLIGTIIHLNIVLLVFNLLPIPPLDGFRVITDLVSADMRAKLTGLERYGSMIFFILVLVPQLNQMTIQRAFSTFVPWVMNTLFSIAEFIL